LSNPGRPPFVGDRPCSSTRQRLNIRRNIRLNGRHSRQSPASPVNRRQKVRCTRPISTFRRRHRQARTPRRDPSHRWASDAGAPRPRSIRSRAESRRNSATSRHRAGSGRAGC